MNKKIIYTDHTDLVLSSYLKDIGKFKILSSSEINELIPKAQSGDIEAKNSIITSNLRFVVTIAKQFQNRGVPLMDLISEGNCGLAYSIEKFDTNIGTPFISYAIYWIKQYIYQAIYWNSREIRLPISQRVKIIQILKFSKAFFQEHGRQPSPSEIEKETGICEEDIDYLSQFSNKSISIDNFIGGDMDNNQICDIIPDEACQIQVTLDDDYRKAKIDEVLNSLPIRARDILILLFGINSDPVPIKQVSRMYGVGTERIRQLKEDALLQLKDNFGNELKELI